MTDGEKPKHIRCRSIIEVLGKPKEHVENTLKAYIENLKEDSELMVLNESFAEAKEQGKLWSTFAELEVVFKDIQKVVIFCLDYMPSSMEVIKPEEIAFKNIDLSNFLNDLQARLHNVDMVAKQLKAENSFLRKNMKLSLNNLIAILLKIREMDIIELSTFTGVPESEIKLLLDKLVEENRITLEETKYRLIV